MMQLAPWETFSASENLCLSHVLKVSSFSTSHGMSTHVHTDRAARMTTGVIQTVGISTTAQVKMCPFLALPPTSMRVDVILAAST